MSDPHPALCICLLTYKRLEYAERTLRSTLDKLVWPWDLYVHIASDGDTPAYINTLRHLAGGYKNVIAVSESNSDRGGYGRNYNLATQYIHKFADYVLPLEDDWELTRDFDADAVVRVFEDPRIGCVRLGYLGSTQALYGHVVRVGYQTVLLLDPASAEPHVFAGHPRLETVHWERLVGPWPEGLTPQETEFAMAHKARLGIAWPLWLDPNGGLFAHIGTVRAE